MKDTQKRLFDILPLQKGSLICFRTGWWMEQVTAAVLTAL
jgi:hypothetical protein